MRLNKLAFLSIFFAVSACCSMNNQITINPVQDQNIELAKSQIGRELLINKISKGSINVAKWIVVAYLGYRAINWARGSSDAAPVAAIDSTVGAGGATVPPIDLLTLSNRLSQLEKGVNPGFLSPGWFKNMGVHVVGLVLAGAGAQVVHGVADKYIDKTFHQANLKWLLKTKTNILPPLEVMPLVVPLDYLMTNATMLSNINSIVQQDLPNDQRTQLGQYATLLKPSALNMRKSLFDELKDHANGLKGVISGSDALMAKKEAIVSVCRSLVKEMELVLGFMEYKISKLPVDAASTAQSDALSISRFIYNTTNGFVSTVNSLLADQDKDPGIIAADLETAITSYRVECGRFMGSFERIEAENQV